MNKYLVLLFFSASVFSQSNFEKVLRSGEVIVSGLSFLKNSKSESRTNSKVIESVCVKNKLKDKITFSLIGKDEEDAVVKKELVIPNEGKECVFELPKGIYAYEIILSNKEIYKKGEYKFEEEVTITVKEN
jgi:hypothetical protein